MGEKRATTIQELDDHACRPEIEKFEPILLNSFSSLLIITDMPGDLSKLSEDQSLFSGSLMGDSNELGVRN